MPQLTLKQHRMRAYLTVQELARRSGVSTDTIWRIQNGERAKPATIWKIVRILNVHPDEVMEFAQSVVGYERNGGEMPDFYRRHDIATLAAQQGVKPVTDPNELIGDFWPEDESTEEFLAALREWRSSDIGEAAR